MRKLMIMASMLAMVLLAASPVMAQDGGDAADDSIGGAGGDVTETQYNTEICQNIVGDINVLNENTAAQYAGDDSAANLAEGDGNAQSISQDEAQAIAQENNTTINIVQQCATGEGVNVIGDAGNVLVPGDDDDVLVPADDDDVIGPAADDFNGDGVVDINDDMNDDGVVGAADAEAVASSTLR